MNFGKEGDLTFLTFIPLNVHASSSTQMTVFISLILNQTKVYFLVTTQNQKL